MKPGQRLWALSLFLVGAALSSSLGLALAYPDNQPNRAEHLPAYQANAAVNDPVDRADIRASDVLTTWYIYMPFIGKLAGGGCPALSNESYGTVAILSTPTGNAESNPDLNLSVRGYISTTAYLGLVDYGGQSDSGAPQLPGLFADNRTGVFSSAHRVYDWDWNCNCRGEPLTTYDVTLAGLAATPGEVIRVPGSGYDIGLLPSGYEVMVLYASASRITLKYTREDNVVYGYTIHIENVCVEPNLLMLYQQMNAAGRARLPALYAGQGLGTAIGNEIRVAIRDTGSFMDPRSLRDWWQGR